LKLLSDDLARSQNAEDLERFETLLDVRSACRIAVEILNDLLCFDKLESGILELHKHEVPVIHFISSCVEMFSSQAREEGVAITNITNNWIPSSDVRLNMSELSMPPADPRSALSECISECDTASMDKFKMDQVLRNLISNALKFTPRGGSVTVCASFIADEVAEVPPSEVPQTMETASKTSLSFLARFPFFKHIYNDEVAYKQPNSEEDDIMDDCELGAVEAGGGGGDMRSTHNPMDRASGVSESNYPVGERCTRAQTQNPPVGEIKVEWRNNTIDNTFTVGRKKGTPFMADTSSQTASHASRTVKGKLRIVVADTGAGISHENQKRLFKEIVQFSPDVLQAGGGSGLGLYITSSIVRMHSGVIHAYSAGANKGSTFTVEIDMQRTYPPPRLEVIEHNYPPDPVPRGRVMGAGNQQHESFVPCGLSTGGLTSIEVEMPYSPLSTADFASPVDMTRMSQFGCGDLSGSKLTDTSSETLDTVPEVYDVLVVDDSNLNRKMLIKLFKTAKYTCDEASDGLIAVAKVKERMARVDGINFFDAILMDFVMPNMDGPTATETIRGLGYTGPIFGVTGNALDSDINFFVNSGVYAVLPKPFDFSRFKQMMKDIKYSSSP
jgi:signal transduction histidine kinase/CheY-like chemotaxis protein